MRQREVAGIAGGRLALDSETLTLLHCFAFTTASLFGRLEVGYLQKSWPLPKI